MVIFPEILGEAELAEFTERDFEALKRVLDPTLARHLSRYATNPESDVTVVSNVIKYLGSTIESYTLHYTLREKGILDLIVKLTPETLLGSPDNAFSNSMDYSTIKEQLTFLDNNKHKMLMEFPIRTRDAYEDFLASVTRVTTEMRAKGKATTFADIPKRIQVNKAVFYVPNAKSISTGCGIINSRRRQWITCLRGLEFKEYCDSKGLNYVQRRNF